MRGARMIRTRIEGPFGEFRMRKSRGLGKVGA